MWCFFRGETTNYGYDDLNRLLSASVTTGPNQYARSWQYNPIGNLTQRVEGTTTNYSYNDAAHKHAVSQAGSNYFCYDANGNMTRRNATSSACTNGDSLAYDVENRLTSMTTAAGTTTFVYNGDGARVKRVAPNGTTYFIGNHYEVYVPTSGPTTFNKFYYFGSQRVAARIAGTLYYLQGDHLGSSSLVMNTSGGLYTRQTYFPFGAQRTTEGSALPTDYTFTGQKNDDSTGLMFYGARYYDATLGRFTQPDTIVPSPLNPQAFNRYSYGYNNPVRYLDPTGHIPCEDQDDCNPGQGGDDQPGDDPNVQPPTTEPFCEEYPYRPECGGQPTQPANDGGKQKPDDDDNCNTATCGGKDPSNTPASTPKAKGNPGSGGGRFYAYRPASGHDPTKDNGPTGGGGGSGSCGGFFGFLARLFGGCAKTTTTSGNTSTGPAISPWSGKIPSNPAEPPESGWVWRGRGAPGTDKGNWTNPDTGEYIHYDYTHHDTFHVDYRDVNGKEWRVYPDGKWEAK